MTTIRCKGFTLRPWRDPDLESLVENADNAKIARNLTSTFPHPYTRRDGIDWISKNKRPEKGRIRLAIAVGGKAVGGIAANARPTGGKGHVASMGYWLGEPHWGKGIMTRAVRAFARHMHVRHSIVRLEATTYPWNRASQRVLEKNGFKYEGTMRKHALKGGKYVDERLYAKVWKGKA